MSRVREKLVSFMSSYTYLALGFSNLIVAKLSQWRLGINSFGAAVNHVGVILNVTIVTLARNYSAHTLEMFFSGAKLILRADSSPKPLRPRSLATGKGGECSSNTQESQTNSWKEFVCDS